MIQIRPVSDLRNKFTEIEEIVSRSEQPVFLTKNGYGSMVVMSIEQYSKITEYIDEKLKEADQEAESISKRYSHEEVFSRMRRKIDE